MSAPRSLTNPIPPDRRRLKAGALVVAGMIAGASLLGLGQRVLARAPSPKLEPRVASIQRFAPVIDTSDVTSPRAGAIVSDGRPDFAFELVVDGPVLGIVVVQCDSHGMRAPGGLRWGTVDFDPILERSSHGRPDDGGWQLAVSEGDRRLNDALGAIPPLAHGTHRLLVQLSPPDVRSSGGYLRAYVIGTNRTMAASAPVFVPGEVEPFEAPTIVSETADPSEPIHLPPRPFDRGAAVAALDAVRFDRCSKRAGIYGGPVEVTIAPTGTVSTATVVDGVLAQHPETARCVTDEIKKQVKIPPFDGAPMRVKKSFFLTPPPGRQD